LSVVKINSDEGNNHSSREYYYNLTRSNSFCLNKIEIYIFVKI
jgi:hypothetical protein